MLTIIHLRDSAFVGGPEKQILGQAKGLDTSRFQSVVISFSASGHSELTEAARADGIFSTCLPDGKLHMPAAVRQLGTLLAQWPNPLVVTSGFKADLTARRACLRKKVPWIAWFHGFTAASPRVRLYEALDMRALRDAHRVVALCERRAEQLRCAGLRNVTVVPNGINAAAARSAGNRAWARAELGLTDEELSVGVVSRLSPEKGIDVFIDSAGAMLDVCRNVRFTIVGDGPMRAALQRQAEQLGVSDRVTFTGQRHDAVALMKAFDVFVLPSHRENLPVVLLEAMACGISIVATDVGGVRELLAGTPAEPVAPGSPGALAHATLALLDDEDLRRAQTEAFAKRVREFSFDRHVETMQAIYEGIASD